MKILIIAKHLYQGLGGIEIQCDLLARTWQGMGHEVVYAATAAPSSAVDATYALTMVDPSDSQAMRRLIREQAPDVVYFRNNKYGLRASAHAAAKAGVAFVFAVSSLQDTQAWAFHRAHSHLSLRRLGSVAWQAIKSRWNWNGFRWIDGAVSLNPDYTDRLPVRNRAQIPDSMESEADPFTWPRPFVAWVAQLKDYKHPEDFVELARRCQDTGVDFLMVGGMANARFGWIADSECTPINFHYLGPMTPRQVNGFLAASELLVHTCDPEGFGNNFIQAWQQGKPTLSLRFDPGGIITQTSLGSVPGDMAGLEADVRALLVDENKRSEIGARAREHAKEHYDPAMNAKRLLMFFDRIIAGKRA